MKFTYEYNGETITIEANNQTSADWMFARKTGGDADQYHGCDCDVPVSEKGDCDCKEENTDGLQEEDQEEIHLQEEEVEDSEEE